jgi:hypothetical protein
VETRIGREDVSDPCRRLIVLTDFCENPMRANRLSNYDTIFLKPINCKRSPRTIYTSLHNSVHRLLILVVIPSGIVANTIRPSPVSGHHSRFRAGYGRPRHVRTRIDCGRFRYLSAAHYIFRIPRLKWISTMMQFS